MLLMLLSRLMQYVKAKHHNLKNLLTLMWNPLALQRKGWATWPLLLVLVLLQQEHHLQAQSWLHVSFITYIPAVFYKTKGHQDTNSGGRSL
jgi:hypothetical protein